MPECQGCGVGLEKTAPRYCNDCRVAGQRLWHPEELKMRMLRAYYDVLNEDTRFQGDLSALAHELQSHFTESLTPPLAAQERLRQFTTEWRLPARTAVTDVWRSLTRRPPGTVKAARLRVTDRTIGISPFPTRIIPPQVEAFDYDPTSQSQTEFRRAVARLAERFSDHILEQAAAIEAEAGRLGWVRLPARRWKQDELRRLARRTYRRTVLHLAWGQIVAREQSEDVDAVGLEPSTVRASVTEWATALGLPLSKGPVGRPKGKK
jgi:hypothetical protein